MTSLFAGRNARANQPGVPVPTLALNLQTSVQGRPRAIGWGTGVLAGNILDVQDFQPRLVVGNSSQPHGGKGGVFRGAQSAAPPNYSWEYYAAVDISLCEGPIASVNRFSGDGLTLSTYGGGTGGGTVFTGTQTQTAWSYMASLHPDHALAYRGEAHVAYGPMYLGTSTSIPSFQYEITFGIHSAGADFPLDANPADVLADFLTNTQYGVPGFTPAMLGDLSSYRNYCQALGLVVSPILSSQSAASSFIADLMKATNAEIVWSGGLLTVVPYGDQAVTAHGATFTPNDTPVYNLSPDDFLPLQGGSGGGSGNTPISVQTADELQLKNVVQLTYLDRSNIYTETPIDHRDEASIAGSMERPTDVRSMRMFCLTSAASMSAALQLTREQVANSYQFTLPRSFKRLDPMDLVELPLDYWGVADEPLVVRIKEIQENQDGSFNFTAEDFLGVATAPLYNRQTVAHGVPDFNTDPGDINPPVLFEMPAAADPSASTAMLYAGVSGGANYGGADVYASTDGVNYVLAQQIKGNARMGVTTALLPTIAGTQGAELVDIGDTLSVDLTQSRGQLGSGTLSDMQNRATLCYVGGELVAYSVATLTALYHYNLAPLLRGAYGSPISAHAVGAPFVRIDGNVVRVPFEKARAGTIVYLKFVPFNIYGGGQKTLADVSAYTYRLSGTALKPEDTKTFPLDDAFTSAFVGAVNAYKQTIVATQAAAVAKAGVVANQKTLTDLNGALASFAQGTYAQFGIAAAATQAEQTSRVTADLASANTNLSTVAAYGAADFDAANKDFIDAVNSAAADRANFRSSAVALAGVKSTQDALATANGAVASSNQTIFAQFGQLSASISINATAIANAQGSISSLQTTVTAQGVSITSNTTAISTINGNLSARYTIDLDVNGIIAGFSIINGGTSASTTVKFRADKFQIYSSSGASTNAAPMFALVTVNGITQMSLDGTMFPDLGVLNRALEANAASHGAVSSGSGSSGNATTSVRAGSRVRFLATFLGVNQSIVTTGGAAAACSLQLFLNTGSGAVQVAEYFLTFSSAQAFPMTAAYFTNVVTAGSWTASARARFGSNTTGNLNEPLTGTVSVEIVEDNK